MKKIEAVATASKEQERGITQINDAVTMLDKATQQNAHVAEDISKMSTEIAQMSSSLVTAASRANFLEEAREGVCNVDLVYDTAKLKVNVLKLKEEVYSKLGDFDNNQSRDCDTITNWINEFVENNPSISYQSVEDLKVLNKNLSVKLQDLIEENANKASNEVLNNKAREVEIESMRIFGTLNHLKKRGL